MGQAAGCDVVGWLGPVMLCVNFEILKKGNGWMDGQTHDQRIKTAHWIKPNHMQKKLFFQVHKIESSGIYGYLSILVDLYFDPHGWDLREIWTK